jgi:hypothetical protein
MSVLDNVGRSLSKKEVTAKIEIRLEQLRKDIEEHPHTTSHVPMDELRGKEKAFEECLHWLKFSSK